MVYVLYDYVALSVILVIIIDLSFGVYFPEALLFTLIFLQNMIEVLNFNSNKMC